MENTIPYAPHLSRHKLNLYRELANRLQEIHRLSKTNVYMQKIKTNKEGKTAECFRQLGEMKKQEAAALKTLENYLKEDAALHPTHHHRKDLDQLARALQDHKRQSGWY